MLRRMAFLLLAAAAITMIAGCAALDESAQLEASLHGPSAKVRIEEARAFLAGFPDSPKRRDVGRKLFSDALELKDEAAALEGAAAYLDATPENRREQLKNQVAWRLAENGLGLEKAEELARSLVAGAREAEAPNLATYLDTLAYVLSCRDQHEEALLLQEEAVGFQPGDAAMVGRLALYQYAQGNTFPAFSAAADAILLGAAGEIPAMFRNWLSRPVADGMAEGSVARDLIIPKVQAFLQESDTPLRRGRAAYVYSLTGIELDLARTWAEEALADAAGNRSRELQSRVTLASVHSAQGNYDGAVSVLLEGREQATPFDSSYWLALGHNYRLGDRRSEAEAALITPLVLRDDPQIRGELSGLGLDDEAIARRIEAEKEALLRFDPGHYAGEPTGRVVLAELFTGAECNPCQAADHAFDLLSEYYPRTMLVILEHHVHIPGADPLTNRDTEARYQYYGGSLGTPTVFFNGLERLTGGGPEILKKRTFEDYDRVIQQLITESAGAAIEASAAWQEDLLEVTAQAEVLSPGPPSAVRFALLERSVAYRGGNGIDPHAWVVRRVVASDASPFLLESGRTRVSIRIDLAELERELESDLTEFEQDPPERHQGFGGFIARPVRMDRSQLGVAVWVQELESKRVLQAEYVEP